MVVISVAQLYATLCILGILCINNNYSSTEQCSVLGDPYSAFCGKQIVVTMQSPFRKHLSKCGKMLHSGSKFKAGGRGSRRLYWGEMGSFSVSLIAYSSTPPVNVMTNSQTLITRWKEWFPIEAELLFWGCLWNLQLLLIMICHIPTKHVFWSRMSVTVLSR